MRLLLSISVGLLAVAWATAIAAPGYKTALLSPEDGDSVLAFEMEGVSLLTPYDEVPDILKSRGYEQVDSGSPVSLRFIKGDYDDTGHYAVPGGIAYEMLVSSTDLNDTIHFRRMNPRTSNRPPPPGPLPDAVDVELAKGLKAFICEKIKDETVRHRSCPPNTDMTIPFMAVNRRTRLTDQLFLQRFAINGLSGIIHLVHYK